MMLSNREKWIKVGETILCPCSQFIYLKILYRILLGEVTTCEYLKMALSPGDPHSFSRPEFARVTNIHLELYVDFNQEVLKGKAILTIEKQKHSITEIILDNYALIIKRVTNPVTKVALQYSIGYQHIVGSSFTIQLPKTEETCDFQPIQCKVQIEYETSPKSPALYWLRPAQTADGTHPFLLSDNKLTFARAVFPCQDTPSVKFSYTATIAVPKDFTVIMSALLQNVSNKSEVNLYTFLQAKQVASYAVIIAVGSLQKKHISIRSNVFAEKKFIDEAVHTFRTGVIEKMLKIAEDLCGPYFWDRYDVCVLPPCFDRFESECPCITFFSPTLLYGDDSTMSLLAQSIAQSWGRHLVTCANYNHLWLNKSISIFVARKIICKICKLTDMQLFNKKLSCMDLNNMIDVSTEANSLKCLIPELTGLLPIKFVTYVPYELGYIFLDNLESNLGGFLVFEEFLKSYFFNFAYKSIKTDDWKEYLCNYFAKVMRKKLQYIDWDFWLYNIPHKRTIIYHEITWEIECCKLAKTWAHWDDKTWNDSNEPRFISVLYKKKNFCDFEEIIFLNILLHNMYKYLSVKKMTLLLQIHRFENKSYQIRYLWLLLCIKVRWHKKIFDALDFVEQFCSLSYAWNIFTNIFEWPEYRLILRTIIIKYQEKMLPYTRKKLTPIISSIDAYLTNLT